jgi:glycosyltransferase involved in cell wall biosynthesis
MQKISVIVPTMWRANDFFSRMIPFIVNSPVVCELIIIDNDSKLRPNDIDFSSEKIKFFDFGENIFFNKSMNVGVEKSTGDIVCLMNDDLIFDSAIFQAISQNFDKETMGMIFPHPAYFNRGKENLELIQKLTLVECQQPLDGFGCCMFIHKDNYDPVPEEFVQQFGDVFYYEMMKKKNKKNYFLHNWVILTPMRVTTAVVPEAQQKILRDWEIASQVLARYGIPYESNDRPVFSAGNLPIRN